MSMRRRDEDSSWPWIIGGGLVTVVAVVLLLTVVSGPIDPLFQ